MGTLWTSLTKALFGVSLLSQAASGISNTGAVHQRTPAPTTCNGHTEYCTRSYSNITFVGSHDSPFVGDLPQQNQNIDIKSQLDMGIRFLQAQTHHSIGDKNVLELCHTSCFLEDAGTLASFLVTVKNWLDAHANEVVTLLLTNGDSVDITEFGDTFAKSGIDSYAFVPASSPNTLAIDDWPTLGDLISSGKRLVVFLGKYCITIYQHPVQYTNRCMCRLRRRRNQSKLHPRRIRLLLRNTLRRNGPLLPKLQHRPSIRSLRHRPHVHRQPLLGRGYLWHQGARPGPRGEDKRRDGRGEYRGAGGRV